MSWKESYFRQADNDFAIYEEFNKAGKPLCQQLHYLQMATEKLSKGYLCSFYKEKSIPDHKTFVDFLRASRNNKLWQHLGYANQKDYVSFVNRLIPMAEKIQNLAPSKENTPNPEYPWESGGVVISPLDYDFKEIYGTEQPELRRIIRLIKELISKKMLR